MGHALANVAARLGARVVLVTTAHQPVDAGRRGRPGRERRRRCTTRSWPGPRHADAVIMAAAVADFRPKAAVDAEDQEGRRRARHRARADHRHPRRARPRPSGPARSSSGSRPRPSGSQEHAAAKLAAKRVDLMVANDVSAPDAGLRGRHESGAAARRRRKRRRDAAADEGSSWPGSCSTGSSALLGGPLGGPSI